MAEQVSQPTNFEQTQLDIKEVSESEASKIDVDKEREEVHQILSEEPKPPEYLPPPKYTKQELTGLRESKRILAKIKGEPDPYPELPLYKEEDQND